ncbi:hypothetical protein SASPL_141393 [Salvia splendens]|uniref:FAR1 domain-containing protein n=1 Tax=Salvia splendens TaxID=180675 RepID=A0A8X8WRK2_SALSN|nr:hypothetical protein SASPL_141393 [Salvia splendens]
MVADEHRHFMRANHSLDPIHRRFMEVCGRCYIGSTLTFKLLKEIVGGPENVGCDIIDIRNGYHVIMSNIDGSDAHMIFDYMQAADFYEHYARSVGFGIRKLGNKSVHDIIKWQYLACEDKPLRILYLVMHPNQLKYGMSKGYVVYQFVEYHNHLMVADEHRHFMTANRSLDPIHRRFMEDCGRCIIGPTLTFKLLKEIVGGPENVGCDIIDIRNGYRDIMSNIDGLDAQMIFDYMRSQKWQYLACIRQASKNFIPGDASQSTEVSVKKRRCRSFRCIIGPTLTFKLLKEIVGGPENVGCDIIDIRNGYRDIMSNIDGLDAQMIFDYMQAADFYEHYARSVGFGIRKLGNKSVHGIIKWQYLACIRQASKNFIPGDASQSTEVSVKKRRCRSFRCNIGFILTFKHLKEIVGGPENVGCDIIDIRNGYRDIMSNIDGLDAQMIFDYMRNKSVHDIIKWQYLACEDKPLRILYLVMHPNQLKYGMSKGYEVYQFVEYHNHLMVADEHRHFMTANRSLDPIHRRFMEDCGRCIIGFILTFKLLKEIVGGPENVGCDIIDIRNADFYEHYARSVGFGIRKLGNKSVYGIIKWQYLACEDKPLRILYLVMHPNQLKYGMSKGYEVYQFVEYHNHLMVADEHRLFMTANRSLDPIHRRFMEDCGRCIIGPTLTFKLLKEIVGGPENVGCDIIDIRNGYRDIMSNIDGSDAQMIFDYMRSQKATNQFMVLFGLRRQASKNFIPGDASQSTEVSVKKRRCRSFRCVCLAKLNLRYFSDGMSKGLDPIHRRFMEDCGRCIIGPTLTFKLLKEIVGGPENVGCDIIDIRNGYRDIMSNIDGSDAQMIFDYMRSQKATNLFMVLFGLRRQASKNFIPGDASQSTEVSVKKRRCRSFRCVCLAKLNLRYFSDGMSKGLDPIHRRFMEDCGRCIIGPTLTFKLLKEIVGGPENVGCDIIDIRNGYRDIMSNIDGSDAQMIFDYMRSQKATNQFMVLFGLRRQASKNFIPGDASQSTEVSVKKRRCRSFRCECLAKLNLRYFSDGMSKGLDPIQRRFMEDCGRQASKNFIPGDASQSTEVSVKKRRCRSFRCECLAKLNLRYFSDGMSKGYEVYQFVEYHNHLMVADEQRHFMTANRSLDPIHRRFMEDCGRCIIGPTLTFKLLKEIVGGPENVGCDIIDIRNGYRDIMSNIDGSDAQMIFDYMRSQKATNQFMVLFGLRRQASKNFIPGDASQSTEVSVKKRRCRSFRCECLAKLNLRYFSDGMSKGLDPIHRRFMEDCGRCIIGPTLTFKLLKEIVGGPENVGCDIIDIRNGYRDIMSNIDGLDAQMIFDYMLAVFGLRRQASKNFIPGDASQSTEVSVKKRRCRSFRCECLAKLNLRYFSDGMSKGYEVYQFVEYHNHLMVADEHRLFMTANRSLDPIHRRFMEDCGRCIIGPTLTFKLLKEIVGGPENVGCDIIDIINGYRDIMSNIDGSDAQMIFDYTQAADFYEHYARSVGFGIRKLGNKSVHGILKWQYLTCIRQASKNFIPGDASQSIEVSVKKRRCRPFRCECLAKVNLRYFSDGMSKGYVVYQFVEYHNHLMVADEHRHFMTANRSLDPIHRRFMEDCGRCIIGPTPTFKLLKEIVGGPENVGCDIIDIRNVGFGIRKLGNKSVHGIIKWHYLACSRQGSKNFIPGDASQSTEVSVKKRRCRSFRCECLAKLNLRYFSDGMSKGYEVYQFVEYHNHLMVAD